MELALVQQQIGLNDSALQEWIEYRTEKKKPLSKLALKKTTNFLLKYDEGTQQRLIDAAVMNDWQGLHWVDPPKQRTTRDTSIAEDLTNTEWAK